MTFIKQIKATLFLEAVLAKKNATVFIEFRE